MTGAILSKIRVTGDFVTQKNLLLLGLQILRQRQLDRSVQGGER
jgi:hypothetical protein